MKYHFSFKDQLTNCGYLDFNIWHSFSQKKKKRRRVSLSLQAKQLSLPITFEVANKN